MLVQTINIKSLRRTKLRLLLVILVEAILDEIIEPNNNN